jgi:hypothetical protein
MHLLKQSKYSIKKDINQFSSFLRLSVNLALQQVPKKNAEFPGEIK